MSHLWLSPDTERSVFEVDDVGGDKTVVVDGVVAEVGVVGTAVVVNIVCLVKQTVEIDDVDFVFGHLVAVEVVEPVAGTDHYHYVDQGMAGQREHFEDVTVVEPAHSLCHERHARDEEDRPA